MIKRSLFLFIILFGIFSIMLKVNKKSLKTEQYQYQVNIIKLERYLYSDTVPEKVIIGSSLSARLINDSLTDVYNLALPGMSVFDGIDILLQKNSFPHIVFIETNFLTHSETPELQSLLNSEAKYWLKKTFPALRDENQPIGIAKGILSEFKKKRVAQTPIDEKLFNELLADQIKQYSNTDTLLIHQSILKLKALVNELEKQGSRVCFFEMPVNAALVDLSYAHNTRVRVLQYFPDNKFIPVPAEKFLTADGVHLPPVEAARYSNYFKNQIKNIQ